MTDERMEIPWIHAAPALLSTMPHHGLLLVTQGKDAKPNAMTIGWGLIGMAWNKPIYTVFVRDSRYTRQLLGQSFDFTVNFMGSDWYNALDFCGTHSGKDVDKFAHLGLTAAYGNRISAPSIAQSLVAVECRTAMRDKVGDYNACVEVGRDFYGQGDYHHVFYGEIVYASRVGVSV